MKKFFKKTMLCFSVLCLSLTACQVEDEQVSAHAQEPLKSLPFLVVDLDGDGIELIPLEESNVYFDVDGDGLAERTQWVHPDDGFLYVSSREEDRVLNSVLTRVMAFFTNSILKIKEHDKNIDGIYNKLDFVPFSQGKTLQELGFIIMQDKKLLGIPNSSKKKSIKCKLDYFSIDAFGKHTLSCLNDKTYGVSEVYFDYEDTNVVWAEMCKRLKRNQHQAQGSERDYLSHCIPNKSNKKGE